MTQPATTGRDGTGADRLGAWRGAAFDVLVVGGGIVGSGIVRDAAMRGLRAGLVEKHDFAFGTSSRSSRLLHGGIRYLAQGRLGLVRQAARERGVLERIAPHLTEPLAFIFPAYRGGWPRWKLQAAMRIYDWLGHVPRNRRATVLDTEQTLQHLPGLNNNGLTGAVRYFDAFTNDARLVIDTIRSATAGGAKVLNYAAYESAQRIGKWWRCALRDQVTDERCEATARVIVNATGPWAQSMAHSGVRLRLTKGVHLVVPRDRLPLGEGGNEAVVMPDGRRILFAIPWSERVILGTTDTPYDGPLDQPTCEPEDAASILRIVNGAFPTAKLTDQDVISAWAGLRPLIASGDEGDAPSDLSRSHAIRRVEPGWYDVAGGKLTTYRLIAEQAVDRIAAAERLSAGRCRTAQSPLLPPGEAQPLVTTLPPPHSASIVRHFVEREWALNLDDVMLRRSSWASYHGRDEASARQVAVWMASALGADGRWVESQLNRYFHLLDAAYPFMARNPSTLERSTT